MQNKKPVDIIRRFHFSLVSYCSGLLSSKSVGSKSVRNLYHSVLSESVLSESVLSLSLLCITARSERHSCESYESK